MPNSLLRAGNSRPLDRLATDGFTVVPEAVSIDEVERLLGAREGNVRRRVFPGSERLRTPDTRTEPDDAPPRCAEKTRICVIFPQRLWL